MAQVRVEQLIKRFGGVTAVDTVSITFHDGRLSVLVGPSGCGKTTLMRMIAGLEEPSSGEIYFSEQAVSSQPAWERNTAMVFQNFALYPHMTVFQNMAFPLQARKLSKAEIKTRVERTAESLGIAPLLNRKPRALSGGQMQRVALGRAIVRQPEVFLMDEPLSNLDALLRVEMRTELKRLQRDLGVTTIYVTHDQAEAMTLADQLIVMRDGRIQQAADPETIYNHPANLFVAQFIGSPSMNVLPTRFDAATGQLIAENFRYTLEPERVQALRAQGAQDLLLGVRPEDLCVEFTERPQAIPGSVYVIEPMGRETLLTIKSGDRLLRAFVAPTLHPQVGDAVWLTFGLYHLFDAGSEAAIALG